MKVSDYIQFGGGKLPVYQQSEVAECGIACLAMAATYHGYKINMLAMRRKYPAGLQGVTVRQIVDAANDIGFVSRVLKLDLGQLAKIKTPAILHWNFNHFVVLAAVSAKGLMIHDPAVGRRKLDWNQASQAFTGIVIELNPGNDFRSADERIRVPLRRFFGRVDGLWLSLAKIFLVALMLQGLFLISPYYIRLVIDHGIAAGDVGHLIWFFAGFLAVLLLTTAAQVVRAGAIMYLDKSLGFQVKANIQRHLLRLPMSFFESRHVGDIKSRFEAFSEVQRLVSRGFITALVEGILSITTMGIMLAYEPLLAAISIGFLALLYVIRFMLTRKESETLEQLLSKQAKENSHFIETIRAMMPIKCYVKENARLSSWLNYFADTLNASVKREKLLIGADISHGFLGKLEYLVIVFVGAHYMIQNTMTVGVFFAFLAYRQHFADSAHSLVEHLLRFRIVSTYLHRMSDIVLQEPETDQSSAHFSKDDVKGKIEARNLHFRYSANTPWLFQGLNFQVEAGESVVLTGRSGLGKSTLLKLLLGLIQPERGDLLVDGHSIRSVGVRNFRSLCATVMQNDQLLNGSLLENIAFFEPSADIERVKEAAKGAAIWDEIQAMPMGLHTPVGDLGSALSGGQKQRILLARALYSAPRILFLDEATSHLDAATEASVNAYLKRENITRVSVAHRQETIAAADRVINLAALMALPLPQAQRLV